MFLQLLTLPVRIFIFCLESIPANKQTHKQQLFQIVTSPIQHKFQKQDKISKNSITNNKNNNKEKKKERKRKRKEGWRLKREHKSGCGFPLQSTLSVSSSASLDAIQAKTVIKLEALCDQEIEAGSDMGGMQVVGGGRSWSPAQIGGGEGRRPVALLSSWILTFHQGSSLIRCPCHLGQYTTVLHLYGGKRKNHSASFLLIIGHIFTLSYDNQRANSCQPRLDFKHKSTLWYEKALCSAL